MNPEPIIHCPTCNGTKTRIWELPAKGPAIYKCKCGVVFEVKFIRTRLMDRVEYRVIEPEDKPQDKPTNPNWEW